MSNQLITCAECGYMFRAEMNSPCPSCNHSAVTPNATLAPAISPSAKQKEMRASIEEREPATLADLLEAQNKTTAAVRSLAVFFFINLCSTLFGAAMIYFSTTLKPTCNYYTGACSNPGTGVAIFGALVIIVGFAWAVIAGQIELRKSK
ncbi:MAG: hypothetical protein KGQ56_01960 [Acidobacteria bacterium]|nr:hypothetical protein [Acidobacteriota bacterium]